MYPIQKSDLFLKIGEKTCKAFGKNIGKIIPFYIALVILWTLIGIWHGGIPHYFVASGVAPLIILVISDVLNRPLGFISRAFRIRTKCCSYRIFESIRTVLIINVIFVFVCSESVLGGIRNIITVLCGGWSLNNFLSCLSSTGLTISDAFIIELALALLLVDDFFINRGLKSLKWLDSQNYLFRIMAVLYLLVMVLWFGEFGVSQFIYFQF